MGSIPIVGSKARVLRQRRTGIPALGSKMNRKDRNIVSAVLMSKDNKILLGKVRKGGVYPNCWHIPGGGIDEGETKKKALIREIREEVGLDIKNNRITLLSDSDEGEATKVDSKTGEKFLVTMHFNVYEVDLDHDARDIKITLNDDLREYRWVPQNKLRTYKHTPPSERLFTLLGWL